MYDDLQSMLRCIVWVKRGGLNTQSREERQCALVREGGDGGGGERERETYLQSMLRCESRPADGWDAARSLARRDVDPAQGEWFQRVACGGAQGGCGSLAGETEIRTAGREGEGLCSGRSRRRAARARANARAHERSATILQSFKQPTAATQRRRGHGRIAVRRELKLNFWSIDAQSF